MKFIHAHQMAKKAIAKAISPCAGVALDDGVVQLGGGLGDRDHETEVGQQLQRGRDAVCPRRGSRGSQRRGVTGRAAAHRAQDIDVAG